MLGKPAKGISKGFVFGSNCPNPDRPVSRFEFSPANDEVPNVGKDMLDGNEVTKLAELTLDVDPVGLDSNGGRPGTLPLLLPLLPELPLG